MRSSAADPAVVIIEDDPTIGHHLLLGLQGHGYRATWSRTGSAGAVQAEAVQPAIVLLDLGLPDVDGVDLANRIRHDHPNTLLIIVTARSSEIDVIAGLDAGADDYLVKPFSLTVLLARLRAHQRRRPSTVTDQPALKFGYLTIDLESRRCRLADRELSMRPKEFDLLATLASRPGHAVSRDDLMSEVWDQNWEGPTKTLDVTIAALRRKLAQAAGAAQLDPGQLPELTTLRGFGYRLDPPGNRHNHAVDSQDDTDSRPCTGSRTDEDPTG